MLGIMTTPNINVMECHDVSIKCSENDLQLPGKGLSSFFSTPVPECLSSRKFNAKVKFSVYLLSPALQ